MRGELVDLALQRPTVLAGCLKRRNLLIEVCGLGGGVIDLRDYARDTRVRAGRSIREVRCGLVEGIHELRRGGVDRFSSCRILRVGGEPGQIGIERRQSGT